MELERRSKPVDVETRRRVGEWMRKEKPTRKEQKETAEMLGVSDRSLRNWAAWLDEEERIGRPPHAGRPKTPMSELRKAMSDLYAAWENLTAGMKDLTKAPGEPTVAAKVPNISKYLVEKFVKKRKQIARRKKNRMIAEKRISVEIVQPGTVTAIDAKHLGWEAGAPIDGHVARDRASDCYQALLVGSHLSGRETSAFVQNLIEHTPIVAVHIDNGPPYRCVAFRGTLRKSRVIPIFSLPRTPQQNGAAEQGMREISPYIPEGGFSVSREAFTRLHQALHHINEGRPRVSREGLTAEQMYHLGRVEVTRLGCYREYIRRKWRYTREAGRGKRARRMADRRAAFDTLEHFGLARITRGKRLSSAAAGGKG